MKIKKIKKIKKFVIKDFDNKKIKIFPKLKLVAVRDFVGDIQHNLDLEFTYIEDGCEEPFANFTLNFGEFIGVKNCAYVDTNNCWFADEILKTGVATDTGLTKLSGFCKYPLWKFKEEFLETVNKEVYKKYSDEYDEYMRQRMPGEKSFDEMSEESEEE